MITEAPVLSCPDCGRSIPPAMPEGLCPACLASAVVDLADAPLPVDAFDSNDDLDGIRYFGDYELLEEIGRGGMGIVYKARQLGVNRIVALKVLIGGAAAGREFVHRFHTEAATAARLDHPNIVPIYEFGEHEGAHFLAMKFMEGGTLQERIRNHSINPRDAAQLMVPIANAVEHAHRHGVLHRDLKPGNILLDAEGQPYVSDFGLARLTDDEDNLTLSGEIMGTIAYIAPEVLKGGALQATTLSDVYGLGAILYELLACQPPFRGSSIADVLRQVNEAEPEPPLEVERSTLRVERSNGDLQTISLKCLDKAPSNRYGTARDFGEDLKRFLNDEPILARPVTRTEKLVRWTRRNPVIASLIAAVCAALLLGATTTLWQLNNAWHNAAESQRQVARLNVLNGVNLLQEGDTFRSLLWFAEALEIEPYAETASPADQLRIATIIAQGPALVNVITHEGQPVGAAAFHPTKDQLATVGRDRRLRLWTIPSGEQVYATEPLDEQPSGVLFSPNSELLLVTSFEQNQARVFASASGKKLGNTVPHVAGGANNRPLTPRFDARGERLLIQSEKNVLEVRTINELSIAGPQLKLSAAIAWMNFSEEGEQVQVITQDGKGTEWDWRTGKKAKSHTPEGRAPRDPNSSATTNTPEGQAPRDPNSLGTTNGFQGLAGARPSNDSSAPPNSQILSPISYLVSTPDNRVQVFDSATHEPLTPPIDHNPNAGLPGFSHDGRYLFTSHPSYAVQVWDLDHDQRSEPPVLLRPNTPPQAVAETDRDGRVFVTHDPNRPIRVRSVSDATEVALHPSSLKHPPVQAWFDHTGQFVIIETENQHAQIWDATTGLPVTPRFRSRYAEEDEEFKVINWPTVESSPLTIRSYASLLSGSRLDGTGGWAPLELAQLIERTKQKWVVEK